MRFLAFEGLDGSGKSTLMQGLKAEFERRRQPFILTREPGGTALGEDIRRLLLRTSGDTPSPRTEALLYQADRAHHVETRIKPALAQGQWVLSDRFAASSIAFQSKGRDIALAQIEWLNEFSTQGLEPDLYILLDLTVDESTRRLARRGDPDRFEQESREFHERVRQAYLSLVAARPEKWLTLSAADSPESLLAQTLAALKKKQWLA